MATATLPAVNTFPINDMAADVPIVEKEPKQPKPVREVNHKNNVK